MARTREGGFRYRISIPYRRSLFFTPNASKNASRTGGSLFEHGAHIPYRRRPFLVQNSANARKEKSLACTECFKRQKGEGHCPEHDPECRREQENNSLRPQNTNALHNLPVTTAKHPTTSIHSHLPSHHSYTPSYTLGQQKTPPIQNTTSIHSHPQAVQKVRFSKCNRPSGPFWQG